MFDKFLGFLESKGILKKEKEEVNSLAGSFITPSQTVIPNTTTSSSTTTSVPIQQTTSTSTSYTYVPSTTTPMLSGVLFSGGVPELGTNLFFNYDGGMTLCEWFEEDKETEFTLDANGERQVRNCSNEADYECEFESDVIEKKLKVCLCKKHANILKKRLKDKLKVKKIEEQVKEELGTYQSSQTSTNYKLYWDNKTSIYNKDAFKSQGWIPSNSHKIKYNI